MECIVYKAHTENSPLYNFPLEKDENGLGIASYVMIHIYQYIKILQIISIINNIEFQDL